MSLANKLISSSRNRWDSSQDTWDLQNEGITYREALILALAGNSGLVDVQIRTLEPELTYVKLLTRIADSIIKEMED